MINYLYPYQMMFSPWSVFGPLFILLLAWSIVWKGIALWKAGRNNQQYWFIALLIINTFGILEIIYLAFFQNNLNPRIIKNPNIVMKSSRVTRKRRR